MAKVQRRFTNDVTVLRDLPYNDRPCKFETTSLANRRTPDMIIIYSYV